MLFLLFLCVLPLTLAPPVEVDGLLHVTDVLDLSRVRMHLNLWVNDTLNHRERMLVKFVATQKVSEINRLLGAVLEFSTNSTILPTPLIPPPLTRSKRNIFGDILHSLTGVATEEQMIQEAKMSEQLRKKMAAVLKHEIEYEKETNSALSGLMEEEKDLAGRVADLERRQLQFVSLVTRFLTFVTVLDSDIHLLEDVLSSHLHGQAPIRQSARLAKKSGLKGVPSLYYYGSSASESQITSSYRTFLFQPSHSLSLTSRNGSYFLRSERRTYLLPSMFKPDSPLTEKETRWAGGECSNCSILYHLHGSLYQVERGGSLSCQYQSSNVTVNLLLDASSLFDAQPYFGCFNRLLSLGASNLPVSIAAFSLIILFYFHFPIPIIISSSFPISWILPFLPFRCYIILIPPPPPPLGALVIVDLHHQQYYLFCNARYFAVLNAGVGGGGGKEWAT